MIQCSTFLHIFVADGSCLADDGISYNWTHKIFNKIFMIYDEILPASTFQWNIFYRQEPYESIAVKF